MPKKKIKTDVKPTKEELKAKQQEAIEAEPVKDVVEEKPPKELPEEPPEEELKTIEKEEVEEEEDKQLKKKLSASARENQKIYAKNRVITKALVDAEDVPEPTEDELKVEFGDWDVMSDTERLMAKETIVSRNWRKVISAAKDQATKIEKWNDSVGEFVGDPKTLVDNPELEGKTESFREFATEEANNSVPFKVLVGAFLHENAASKKPNKGKMFEKGSGGPNEKPQIKSDKLSLEESRKLRERDYNKWKEYLIAGKIVSDL